MNGYLKCSGRLNGCPVTIFARHNGFVAVRLLERRGAWEKGDDLTVEEKELTDQAGGSRDMFDDLPMGIIAPYRKRKYIRVEDYEEDS